ncbi:MAG: 1-acyl-sn-glycerol-3-phosphate acyltransferase [Tannerella sp.]|jgi:1-acyl-sn-glycerol-3-phosphate acyltransferase|nr:1-acyl-sn-glycerol-3-phosphate acyltransferase [Tannerella sp.]
MMSIDYSKYNFDDIRPLNNDEVHDAIESLTVSEGFRTALRYIMPGLNWEQFAETMRNCKTKEEFKTVLAYNAVMQIAKATTFSLTISGRSRVPDMPCTFISNHRDIVLDAAFLNALLLDIGHGMTQIAIGDNLLIHPWIDLVVKLNNCFIVKRDMPVRKLLEASQQLSAYIHHTIKDSKESVWIAQREGRAKDSNDHTQNSVLKMLNMAGQYKDNILRNLMDLNIVPIAISYEYDPCDFLKAEEFQQKRDNPDFIKSKRDDLFNMETGLLNNKGRVHFTIGSPINDKLALFENTKLDKNVLIARIAEIIDKEIYKHYRFYPCNYVAYDLLHHSVYFRTNYDLRDKMLFETYVQKQIDKINLPDKDEIFLRTKILEMYSNPLKNHMNSIE